MKGLPLVDLPSSRKRTRSDVSETCFTYSTILSHRASLLSVPMRKPKNCSGAGTACCALGAASSKTASARPRILFMLASRGGRERSLVLARSHQTIDAHGQRRRDGLRARRQIVLQFGVAETHLGFVRLSEPQPGARRLVDHGVGNPEL